MFSTYLKRVILRDLEILRAEVEAYPDEKQLWEQPTGITNSGGTLALHLVGNVRHFLGAVLGGSTYVRDRPGEFDDRNVARKEIQARIDAAIDEISAAFDLVTDEQLAIRYPLDVGGVSLDTGQFLAHLSDHFGYHLGQLNYHRRIVTGINEQVGGSPIAALV